LGRILPGTPQEKKDGGALATAAKRRVAVVGAGMGGLAAAIRLAAMGFEVEVF